MSIIQFLRIFWARRSIVLIMMISAFLGSIVVVQLVRPQYEAKARVMLDVLRPDPVTGEVLGRSANTFVASQTEILRDYRVTGAVVDRFGWLSDPTWISQYAARPESDTRDFRRWLSQQVSDNTSVQTTGTVMEITYRAPSPTMARDGAETLRSSLLEASIDMRRQEAAQNAKWFSEQAAAARQAAEAAEMAKAQYERESGIIMDGRSSDLESERLAALVGQVMANTVPTTASSSSSGASLELAQIDAQITQLSTRLGPNHPQMQDLRAKRTTIASVVAQERAASRAGTSPTGVLNQALEQQKARVVGQREAVERLRQLQSEVDLRRDQYKSTAGRAAQYMMEASVVDNGMTPLGVVVTPSDPAFPNKKLMVGGAVALGMALGLALSLLLELLNRRVRGVEDLNLSSEIHCVGVVRRSGPGYFRALLQGLTPRRAIKREVAV